MKDPTTPAEWQEAVNLAETMSRVYSARLYGLVTGGPRIDIARCRELLHKGSLRGVRPQPAVIDGMVLSLAGAH